MRPIEWKEQFKIDVQEIDEQHKVLLDIFNQIVTSVEKKNEWRATSSIVDSLIHHAYRHFATEERYMIKHLYPDLPSHIGKHLDFIKKVTTMTQEVKEKGPEKQKEMVAFLAKWYYDHVLVIDKKYSLYLDNIGVR
jgi:hemerythrin